LNALDFFGGEPFLRKDLTEITRIFCDNHDIKTLIIPTNGFLTDTVIRYTDEVRKFYDEELKIGVSIDGLFSLHDRIRRVPGGFNKAIKTYNALKKRDDVITNASGTITKDNYKQVYEMFKFFKGNFLFTIAHNNPTLDNIGTDFSLNKEQKEEIKEQIEKIIKDIERKRFCWEKILWDEIVFKDKKLNESYPCTAPYDNIFIDPYGDVYPCINFNESFGSVKNASIESLLAGKKSEEIRDKIKNCKCNVNCLVFYSLSKYIPFYFWNMREFAKWKLKQVT
jgi:MoaA/NifB/PqqE/SkfB family radical SAM enzyme